MEFGKVEEKELDKIDFRLPKDHKDNVGFFREKTKSLVYVGCAKWGRKDWIGKIYPKGTKEADFLKLYSRQFNSIELNSTFYQLPTSDQVKKWVDSTPDNFLFVPKFNDVITHRKRLNDCEEFLDNFYSVMSGLGKKLGPVFLMPHPQMGPKKLDTIRNFIKQLPHEPGVFLELRHDDWYLGENFDAVFEMMKETGTGSIITDSAGRRDCVHMRLSTGDAFIRFVGNSLHASDYERIDDWVKRLKKWIDGGIGRIFFFMHQHEELYSPELCKYLVEQLNKKCKLQLHLPQFVEDLKLL